MFPLFFSIGTFSLSSYAFFWILGYGAALTLTLWLARQRSSERLFIYSDACLIALLAGILGARFFFVATNLEFFRANPQALFSFWSGGLVFVGGVAVAIPACALYFRKQGIPVARGFDLLAPGLALGQAFGRIGCLAAGCCHGDICHFPWAIYLNSPLVEVRLRHMPIHPTQIYESAGLFLLAGLLVFMNLRRAREGLSFLSYFILYGLLRFVVEFFRGDSIRGEIPGIGLSTSQGLALILLAVGGSLLFLRVRRNL
jgi:phosphatidylglycerol:prolipoprotein diacylglycerol transferase